MADGRLSSLGVLGPLITLCLTGRIIWLADKIYSYKLPGVSAWAVETD